MADLSWIRRIFYINLDHRDDRRVSLEQELASLHIPSEQVQRISATKSPLHGAVGCLKSHIEVLKHIQADNIEDQHAWYLVLEDDAQFDNKSPDAWHHLQQTLQNDQNIQVFLLSVVLRKSATYDPTYVRVLTGYTSAAYLIRKGYVETLLKCFHEALERIEVDGFHHRLALDVFWRYLQKRHLWLTRMPVFVSQRPSFSDVRQKHMTYDFTAEY